MIDMMSTLTHTKPVPSPLSWTSICAIKGKGEGVKGEGEGEGEGVRAEREQTVDRQDSEERTSGTRQTDTSDWMCTQVRRTERGLSGLRSLFPCSHLTCLTLCILTMEIVTEGTQVTCARVSTVCSPLMRMYPH